MKLRRVACLAIAVTAAAAGTASVAAAPRPTFAEAGRQASAALLRVFYAGGGRWHDCDAPGCNAINRDWGADSLTYALWLRWRTTGAPQLVPVLRALVATAPAYPAPCAALPCSSWSDVPEWDAIALLREFEATGSPRALAKARAAFAFVERSRVFALGACPGARYQLPGGAGNRLKTLETDGNAIKAALLLYRATHAKAYLESARRRYATVRALFLDPEVPLYSVYVFDDGRRCAQLPHRFFASVNGDLIWSGVELYRLTGKRRYLDDARATARAVDRRLSDARGVFADLQAENDVVEPLVEGMFDLATKAHVAFARRWILRNAGAALSARAPNGAFGRFFDGPAPATAITAWQTNGGFALEIAAAALDPKGRVPARRSWAWAAFVPHEIARVPAALTFTGSGIALVGVLGERCCEPGHARVLLDGRMTFDRTGIWQNKSSAGRTIPRSILFAWRWPRRGRHTIRFEPGLRNGKEGGSFLHLTGYLRLP